MSLCFSLSIGRFHRHRRLVILSKSNNRLTTTLKTNIQNANPTALKKTKETKVNASKHVLQQDNRSTENFIPVRASSFKWFTKLVFKTKRRKLRAPNVWSSSVTIFSWSKMD